jgi:glycosyltransferase involved in cell wall biosynthesis
MKLHLLGLPHTVTTSDYSSCAFTGKIMRFSPMVRSRGFEIIHYGVEGAQSGANRQVDVMTLAEQESFIGKFNSKDAGFIGRHAVLGSPLYTTFNSRLRLLLKENAEAGDIICLPFGMAHYDALQDVQDCFFLESGIGYNQSWAPFRVFESESWLHHILGKEIGFKKEDVAMGNDYYWVAPNYYDLNDWPTKTEAGSYVLFMARMIDTKGLNIVAEIAKKMPSVQFLLAGQGNPSEFLTSPNMRYIGPVTDKERGPLFANAIATICPSRYVEPFCGVAVESMLCGTPAIGSSFGAFTETIKHGVSGFRARTLGEWVDAINICRSWGPEQWKEVSDYARGKYDMYQVAITYESIFNQLSDLSKEGWYSPRSQLMGPSN